ncbi:hypothetical protein RCL1_003874 [Eukaryota sp. TZLM3-RCL]
MLDPTLLRNSLPACIQEGLTPLNSFLLTSILGHQSTSLLAGYSSVNLYLNPFNFLFSFLLNGVTSGIAFSLGQNYASDVAKRVRLALNTALSAGFIVGSVFYFLSFFLLPDDVSFASSYFRVRSISVPFVLIMTALCGISRGFGHVNYSLYIQIIFVSFNCFFNYLFLKFFGVTPRSSLFYSGIASLIAEFSAIIVGFFLLWKKLAPLKFWTKISTPILGNFKATIFIKESSFLFIKSFMLQLSFFITGNLIMYKLSKLDMAGYQVVIQLWLIAGYLTNGIGVIVNSQGSKLFGKGDVKKLCLLVSNALQWSIVFIVLLFGTFYFFDNVLIKLFTNDPVLVTYLLDNSLMKIVLVFLPFNSLIFVLDAILFATQDYSLLCSAVVSSWFLFFLPSIVFVLIHEKLSIAFLFICLGLTNFGRNLFSCYYVFFGRNSTFRSTDSQPLLEVT